MLAAWEGEAEPVVSVYLRANFQGMNTVPVRSLEDLAMC